MAVQTTSHGVNWLNSPPGDWGGVSGQTTCPSAPGWEQGVSEAELEQGGH